MWTRSGIEVGCLIQLGGFSGSGTGRRMGTRPGISLGGVTQLRGTGQGLGIGTGGPCGSIGTGGPCGSTVDGGLGTHSKPPGSMVEGPVVIAMGAVIGPVVIVMGAVIDVAIGLVENPWSGGTAWNRDAAGMTP